MRAGLLQTCCRRTVLGATLPPNMCAPGLIRLQTQRSGDSGMIRTACSQRSVHIPAAPLTPSTTASDAMIATRKFSQADNIFLAKLLLPPAARNVYSREEAASRSSGSP